MISCCYRGESKLKTLQYRRAVQGSGVSPGQRLARRTSNQGTCIRGIQHRRRYMGNHETLSRALAALADGNARVRQSVWLLQEFARCVCCACTSTAYSSRFSRLSLGEFTEGLLGHRRWLWDRVPDRQNCQERSQSQHYWPRPSACHSQRDRLGASICRFARAAHHIVVHSYRNGLQIRRSSPWWIWVVSGSKVRTCDVGEGTYRS